MGKKRIVVTGAGIVSAIGHNLQATTSALFAHTSGIGSVSAIDTSAYTIHIAAQVADGPWTQTELNRTRLLARNDRFGLTAFREARRMAGLEAKHAMRESAIVLGAGAGGMLNAERFRRAFFAGKQASLRLLPAIPANVTTDIIAADSGLTGLRATIATACSSSNSAIGQACDLIRYDGYPMVITGGAEALSELTFAGFHNLRNMDKNPCKPFAADRKGLNLGECGAILILEDYDHARGRKAGILAEILDYGTSCDAHHITTPHPQGQGAYLAMAQALAKSGLKPKDIDYINAHGTGTKLNDISESRAIMTLFGEQNRDVPVSSSKSYVGHCLGAAGAVEAVFCILALREQVLLPTLRYQQKDPAIHANIIGEEIKAAPVTHILSNSFGFGGNNAAIVFKRWQA